MMTRYPFQAILLCCLLLSLVRPAQAQVTAENQVAEEFIRSATAFMGYSQVSEGDAPLVLAGTLLDAAIQLNPKNADAWAMRAELAEAAGDLDSYERALAGYLDTGIKDDRARFNLIRYRVSKSDTLDAQLRSLETLLNSEAGRALSGPLRSRVASLAASIGGELLDKRSQRRWAVEAARQDAANVEAANTMRDLVIELGGDNVRVGTATVNIIRANPIDPLPRVELASLLAGEAAFQRAAQQYQVVASRLSSRPMPIPAYLSWAQCMAMIGEDLNALNLIENIDNAIKNQAEAAKDQEDQSGDEQAGESALPQSLPLHFELIRLSVLDGEDDKAAAQTVLDRIGEQLKAEQPEAGEAAKDADPELGGSPESSLALIAAAFGPDLEQAEKLAAALPADNASQAIAMGWVALRQGDRAKAEPLLRPHAGKHTMADVALAMVLGQDNAGRARLLSAVIQQAPSSMASLAAGRQLVALAEKPRPTATGKTLTDLMGKYPESFWLVDVERIPWLEVRMKIQPQRIKPMQPMRAEITVWNTTRFPLAIDEQGPIRPQAMVLISATSSGLPMAPTPPIVIDMGRRFVLGAGERLVFDVPLDYHHFGMLRAQNPGLPLVFDARLLVNPVMTRGGTWLASGVGGVSEIRNCLIQSKPAKAEDIDRWIQAVAGDDTTSRLEALGRLANLSKKTQEDLVGPAVLERTRPVLKEAWAKGNQAQRAWLVMNAIELEDEFTSYPDLFKEAAQSDSNLIWLAMLSRQVKDSDSSVLRDAIGRQDMPDISRFAERQRRLLREYKAYVDEQQRLREEQQPQQEPGGLIQP